MPTVPTSPSTCTYSWLFAYLLSSGVIGSLLLLRAFIERRGNDARTGFLTADQNTEFRVRRRFSERKICEADRFFQCRRMGTAGDDADLFLSVDDRIAVAGDTAVHHLESDQLSLRPLGLLAL